MKFKDLAAIKNIKGQSKRLLDSFLKEPWAFKLPANGWRAVVFVPDKDPESENIIIDIIPIKEWGFFTSLKFPEQTESEYLDSKLLRTLSEVTLPIIPEDYQGPLSWYFNDIQEIYPTWNRTPPPSLIFGMLSPIDTRTTEEIEILGREMYIKMSKSIERVQAASKNLSTTLEQIFSPQTRASKKEDLN